MLYCMTSLHAKSVKQSYLNCDFVLSKQVIKDDDGNKDDDHDEVIKCKEEFIYYYKIIIVGYYSYPYPDRALRNQFLKGLPQ